MRVCLVIEGALDAKYGGGQIYVRHLAHALSGHGHSVTVLECGGAEQDRADGGTGTISLRGHEIRVLRLPSGNGDIRSASEALERSLREALRQTASDVVHVHGLKLQTVRACADIGLPCIVTAHHGGLVCPAGTLLDYRDAICARPINQAFCTLCCVRQQPFGSLWGALLSSLPIRLQLAIGKTLKNTIFIPYLSPALLTPLHVRDKGDEVAELLAKADILVAPSKAMQSALLRNGARPERTVFIPHGIPLGKPAARPARSGGAVTRFAYVGRLNRVKGLYVLIQAFNRLEGEAELHIIGSAANKWERRYWASVLKHVSEPERLIQHGHLCEEALRVAVASCDVVILPSIYLEVFGLTVAEAFSIGRPVIVTSCGGPAEQVRNGIDGVIVPPGDVSAMADAMQEFVNDSDRARSLARNIRHPISMDQHVEALVNLYSRCIADAGMA